MNNIFYKVVRKVENKYVSAISNGFEPIEYKIGVAAKPKVGKLFVFEHLESARDFIRVNSLRNFRASTLYQSYIFTARCENPIKGHYCIANLQTFAYQDILWDRISHQEVDLKECYDDVHFRTTPEGTLFADSVTLLEEIS